MRRPPKRKSASAVTLVRWHECEQPERTEQDLDRLGWAVVVLSNGFQVAAEILWVYPERELLVVPRAISGEAGVAFRFSTAKAHRDWQAAVLEELRFVLPSQTQGARLAPIPGHAYNLFHNRF